MNPPDRFPPVTPVTPIPDPINPDSNRPSYFKSQPPQATGTPPITDVDAHLKGNLASLNGWVKQLDDKIQALQRTKGDLSAADQPALDDIAATSAKLAETTHRAIGFPNLVIDKP